MNQCNTWGEIALFRSVDLYKLLYKKKKKKRESSMIDTTVRTTEEQGRTSLYDEDV